MAEIQQTGNGVAWSDRDLAILRQLVALELPMRFIAKRLGKSEQGVRVRAQQLAFATMRCGELQRTAI